jgi:hypothetical protein
MTGGGPLIALMNADVNGRRGGCGALSGKRFLVGG